MNDPAVTIAGGGLSGLAAALAVARRGRAAHVFMLPRRSAGSADMLPNPPAAGLQDALFGFGMRCALVSGYLAGNAFATNDLVRYTQDYRRRFGRAIRASAVNRYLYRLAGRRGYRTLVERVAGAADPRGWLKGYYNGRWWMPFVFPLARADAQRRRASPVHECREGCDCTYCRCLREAAGQQPVDDTTVTVDRNVSDAAHVSAAHRKAC